MKLNFSDRVGKCQRYFRYICVKILVGKDKKCKRPRSFVKCSRFWVNSASFDEVLSLNQLDMQSQAIPPFCQFLVIDGPDLGSQLLET